MNPRLVVLVSGSGTLLQALLDARRDQVVLVVADRECPGIERAQHLGIPTAVVSQRDFPDRQSWNVALAEAVGTAAPDWVISAGFMRILGAEFLDRFAPRVLNCHPALLPAFPGAHGVADALAYGVKVSGCTVHLVDAGVDTGPIIAQRPVAVADDDDEASLHERIKVAERELLVEVVAALGNSDLRIDGRRVTWA